MNVFDGFEQSKIIRYMKGFNTFPSGRYLSNRHDSYLIIWIAVLLVLSTNQNAHFLVSSTHSISRICPLMYTMKGRLKLSCWVCSAQFAERQIWLLHGKCLPDKSANHYIRGQILELPFEILWFLVLHAIPLTFRHLILLLLIII